MTQSRQAKEALYTIIAQVAQAIANSHRLELIDLLVQAPRTVEQLATASGMTIANTSQHLQRLKRASLVESERQGTSVIYRLADPAIAGLWVQLRRVAEQQQAEMDRAIDSYRPQRHLFSVISAAELRPLLAAQSAVLLDVRPAQEYEAGHLPSAISIPLNELAQRLGELPDDKLIVTYCRGPLCVYADEALALIIESGREGSRLEDGVAEWQLAGHNLAGVTQPRH